MRRTEDRPANTGQSDFESFEIDHDSPEPTERLLGDKTQLSDAKPTAFGATFNMDDPEELMVQQSGPSLLVSSGHMRSRGPPRWVVLPDSLFRTRWIQCQLVIAMYIIWVTPVRVGFDLPAQGTWFWVEGLIDIFFYADLVMNFFTAYEDTGGELVTDHKRIAKRYLRTWFVVDFLATFPVEYIVRALEGTWGCSARGNCHDFITGDTNVDFLKILRALRVFRIIWILKNFKRIRLTTMLGRLQDELFTVMPVVSILELLAILLYLGHISGCFFYYFSTPKWRTPLEKELVATGEIVTWMQHSFGGTQMLLVPDKVNMTSGVPLPPDVLMDKSSGLWYQCPDMYDIWDCSTCTGPKVRCYSHYGLFFRYITSMYWAYTTMTTVGYGDISSITVAEKIWAIIVMIVSGFFFSFVVGRVAVVVARFDADQQAYDQQMEMVGIFLRDTALPRHLSKRVMHHFKTQRYKGYDPQNVLNRLPFELKSKLLRQMYSATIRQVPLLQRQADDDLFVSDVCIRLQEYSCAAETFVYQRGEAGGDVFVLLRGELLVLDLDQHTPLYHVGEGAVFGEEVVLRHLQGFERAKRSENVWCRGSCRMLRIGQVDMLDLLAQYPALLTNLKKLHRARQYNLQQARKQATASAAPDSSTAAPPPQPPSASPPQPETVLRKVLKRASFSASNLKQLGSPHQYSSLGDPTGADLPQPNHHREASMLLDLDDLSLAPEAGSSPLLQAYNPAATSSQLPDDYPKAAGPLGGPPGAVAPAVLEPPPAGLPPRGIQALPSFGRDLNRLSTTMGRRTTHDVGTVGAISEALMEEVSQLRRLVSEQQQYWMDELQYQRYLIHQVPGRVMNHLVMVIGQPSEEQRKQLERATLAWNEKNRWKI